MNEYEVHETALKQVCKEIQDTLEKIEKNGMSEQLLDRLDKLYHTKKSILTSWSMEHPEEYYEGNSRDMMSGARGRNPMTGRYVSNDGYPQGNSGHWPMNMNPYYPDQRRW